MRFDRILVDSSIQDRYLTKLILENYKGINVEYISRYAAGNRLNGSNSSATRLPEAKRELLLTRNPGSFFKYMGTDPCVSDSQRAKSTRFELFQGCPLDCHYCFCQQYLSCHNVVVFVNIEDSMEELFWKTRNASSIMLVTGDIADSLALGKTSIIIHRYLADIIPEVNFELRSKFKLPENYSLLDRNRFHLDWSLSPASAWKANEPGTASPATRINSIKLALSAGFNIGIRLDPLQNNPGQFEAIDRASYETLIKNLKQTIYPDQPSYFIVGSYKITSELKNIIRKRFPASSIPGLEWSYCSDRKLRPFRKHRLDSYSIIIELLQKYFPDLPIKLSMEFPFVLNLLNM